MANGFARGEYHGAVGLTLGAREETLERAIAMASYQANVRRMPSWQKGEPRWQRMLESAKQSDCGRVNRIDIRCFFE